MFDYTAPFHGGPGKEGEIFTPAVGLLKNLQSSFLETLKILQPWYQRLQCPTERGAERVPGTPSSRQRLAGSQGLRAGPCFSAREGSKAGAGERPSRGGEEGNKGARDGMGALQEERRR